MLRGSLQCWLAIGMVVLAGTALRAEGPAAPFDFRYVPADAPGALALRPAAIMTQPGLAELSKQGLELAGVLLGKKDFRLPAALRAENVDQVVAALTIKLTPKTKEQKGTFIAGVSSMLIRMKVDCDWLALVRDLGGDVKEAREGEQTYYTVAVDLPMFGKGQACLVLLDRRTLVVSLATAEGGEPEFVRGVMKPRDQLTRPGCEEIVTAPIAVLLRNPGGKLLTVIADELKDKSQVAKLLGDVTFFALGIELGEGRPVRLLAETKNAVDLEKACRIDCAVAGIIVAEGAKQVEPEAQASFRLLGDLLRTGEFHIDGDRVSWTGHSTIRLGELFGVTRPTAAPADQ